MQTNSLIEEEIPIIQFLNNILIEAVKFKASDIHFELYENEYRIRYRQDGRLLEVAKPHIKLAQRITSRIKIMANLDIAERRIPQDGRFTLNLANQTLNFRVNTCPTIDGEKVVVRILNTNINSLEIDSLGFNIQQKTTFLQAIERPQGLILVTGPTGSGKTVTLYSAINFLNKKDKNILTVEDPVEIKISGVNQVNINSKVGLTFATALRAFLRQDPDIIMVGEIRDVETAEIAIKAAQTGHLVFSTLHTNSATETLTRLTNIGILHFNIANSISMVIAQRLVRLLCAKCKIINNNFPDDYLLNLGFTIEELKTTKLYRPGSCKFCHKGYLGRTGLFEILPIDIVIQDAIMQNTNSLDLLKIARNQGMHTIFESGLQKVKQGLTSIEELLIVTN